MVEKVESKTTIIKTSRTIEFNGAQLSVDIDLTPVVNLN